MKPEMKPYTSLIKTKSDLKYWVSQTGSYYFDKGSMKFFGDTMGNYGLRKNVEVVTDDGEKIVCFELYRKRAVKHGLKKSTYFDVRDLNVVYPKEDLKEIN